MAVKNLKSPVPLDQVFPGLVAPLKNALIDAEEPELAASVDRLQVKGVCGCGDPFCASFATADPQAARAHTHERRTIALGGESPLTPFAVDVADDEIYFIEIIDADLPATAEFKQRYDSLVLQAPEGRP